MPTRSYIQTNFNPQLVGSEVAESTRGQRTPQSSRLRAYRYEDERNLKKKNRRNKRKGLPKPHIFIEFSRTKASIRGGAKRDGSISKIRPTEKGFETFFHLDDRL